MAIVERIVLDLTDVGRSTKALEKELKRMQNIAGGIDLRIDGRPIKDLSEKSIKPLIKNFTHIQDSALKAADRIKMIDKAIKQLRTGTIGRGAMDPLAQFTDVETQRRVKDAYDEQLKAMDAGTREKQILAGKAGRTAISWLRKERAELVKLTESKKKVLEVTAHPKLTLEQRVMAENKQRIRTLRKEYAELAAKKKQNILLDEERIRRGKILVELNARRASMTRRQRTELMKYNKEMQKQASGGGGMYGGSLFSVGRMGWFVQLRLFWTLYRAVGTAMEGLAEKDEAMARSLRTAKFAGAIQDRTDAVREYSRAINDTTRQLGVNFREAGEALYQFGSAGLTSEEAISALTSTMKLVVGTEGEVTEVTKAVAGIYNNFGDTMKDNITISEKMSHINNVLAVTWKNAQAEIGELIQGLNLSSQMARQSGISFEELTAMLGVLNTHMIKGGRAGRSLQNILARMSQAPLEFARTFGIAFDPTKPLKFIDIMTELNKRMKTGALSVAEVGDIFARMGLRGAPAFASLIQNWDEVGEAIARNMKKGTEAVDGLSKEMEDHFNRVLKRWTQQFKLIGEAVLGDLRDMTRDFLKWSSDKMEAFSARLELQDVVGKAKAGLGKGYTVEDIDKLTRMIEIWKTTDPEGYTREIAQTAKIVNDLEMQRINLHLMSKYNQEQAVKRQQEEAAALKAQLMTKEKQQELENELVLMEPLTVENARKKLAILQEQRKVQYEDFLYYRQALSQRLGESGTVVKQKKEVLATDRKIKQIEDFLNRGSKQRANAENKIALTKAKMLAEITKAEAKSKTGITSKGRVYAEEEAEAQKLAVQRDKYLAIVKDKNLADQWYNAQRIALAKTTDDKILEIERAHDQKVLDHKTSLWVGGGGMGSSILGVHAQWLQKKKAQDQAEQDMDKDRNEETVEAYKMAKEQQVASQIEGARTTMSATSDIFAQMAQLNKKWFKFYQITAIAETLIATAQGVMQAYAQAGPYVGTAMAAFIVAQGALKIAMIRKQQPPEYATGGVLQGNIVSMHNRGQATNRYGTGGVTSGAAHAILGDNPSGRELVIPAENIKDNYVSGYSRDSGEGGLYIINTVTQQDIATAMAEAPEGRGVIVNTIGNDMAQRKSTYRQVRGTRQKTGPGRAGGRR